MNPMQLLLIMKARYKIALLIFISSILVGGAVTWWLPRQYAATATVVFDVKQQDPVAGMIMPIMPGYLATQVEIITSDRVAKRIVRSLRLDESPAVKQSWIDATSGRGTLEDWTAQSIKRGLLVTPSLQSNTISISYKAGDANFAATVANAYAQAYIDANIELKVDPARQITLWFGEQGKIMRENLEKAQSLLSAFQQKKGIVAKDEGADAESAQLNTLMGQLTAMQAQTADATSKQRTSNLETLPAVMQSPLVAALRNDILRKEAALQDAAVNIGKNHPQYERMVSEIETLKKQLAVETQHVATSFTTTKTASREVESELRAAIAAQKKKLLSLRDERDQLAVLQRDVIAAQAAYEAVTRRYNQTSLESQITQTNVSVLNSAIAPLEPSSPNVPKILAMAIFFGFLLGGGAAFLWEMIDRRVRSAGDLAEMLQLPVLAVIEPPRRPMLAFWRLKMLTAPR